ncbi:MAG: ribonuclease R [Deltaproteobacteria bacterium]|nr:ribonuclease R [Deltaproteobacteria bacterium]
MHFKTILMTIPTKQSLLQFMQQVNRPLSLKELMRQMLIPKEEREVFKRLIKDLVQEGEVIKIRGERYGLPLKMNLVVGELSCHPNGFGFVAPEEGGEDIFINPRNMKGAMHKDKVVVRSEGRSKGNGKREGRILRILERAHKTIVGRFEKGKGFDVVIPSEKRILQEIIIPAKDAKNVEEGKIVEAEIIRWPGERTAPLGRIVAVLGEPDDPDVEIEVIVKKYELSHRFPHNVILEAKEISQEVAEHDILGRVDLRERTTFTIDGETAKDFDDAVSIEKLDHGYRLRVSIADVAHYVRDGNNLDKEAHKRGTSVYFPDRCIPMLPEALSNGICSLNPHVDRLTVTAEMDFDHQGNVTHSKFYESVIKSCERLTYTKVRDIFANPLSPPFGDRFQICPQGQGGLMERYSHIMEDLKTMQELCLKLRQKRGEMGSIDFDLPEPQIIIDIEGRVEDIVKSERNIAHQMIEEFMLAANQAVATYVTKKRLPFLYRVHEEPDAESMHEFKEFIRNFGCNPLFPPFGDRFQICPQGQGGLKKLSPKVLQNVLSEAEGKPEEKLINHILLRSMKQARYSEKNIGHFGLAFEYYTHFTSPIRRYPDLIVHRILKKIIKGRYSEKDKEAWGKSLPEIAAHTSNRERRGVFCRRACACGEHER